MRLCTGAVRAQCAEFVSLECHRSSQHCRADIFLVCAKITAHDCEHYIQSINYKAPCGALESTEGSQRAEDEHNRGQRQTEYHLTNLIFRFIFSITSRSGSTLEWRKIRNEANLPLHLLYHYIIAVLAEHFIILFCMFILCTCTCSDFQDTSTIIIIASFVFARSSTPSVKRQFEIFILLFNQMSK